MCNLRRARQKWAQLTPVLSREGSDSCTLGQIYLEVVQFSLIYGSETWVLMPRMKRVLGGFHYRGPRRLTGQQPQKGREGGWVYPPCEDAMAEVGLHEVDTYIYHHQNTVAQYILTRPIIDLCLTAKHSQGQGWQCGGGNRRVWIWRRCGRRLGS